MTTSATDTQTRHFAGGAISFEAGSNEIEVLGGAAPGTVDITRRSRWGIGTSKPHPNEAWGEKVLEIGLADCGGVSWRCSIDYLVRVPDGTAVTVQGGSGDISVDGALGAVELSAGSGDIDGRGLAAERVVVRTGSGSVDLDLRTAPRAVDVETGSGDVGITVPEADQFRLDIDTGSGDQHVGLPSTANADSTIRVRTGSGDVELE